MTELNTTLTMRDIVVSDWVFEFYKEYAKTAPLYLFAQERQPQRVDAVERVTKTVQQSIQNWYPTGDTLVPAYLVALYQEAFSTEPVPDNFATILKLWSEIIAFTEDEFPFATKFTYTMWAAVRYRLVNRLGHIASDATNQKRNTVLGIAPEHVGLLVFNPDITGEHRFKGKRSGKYYDLGFEKFINDYVIHYVNDPTAMKIISTQFIKEYTQQRLSMLENFSFYALAILEREYITLERVRKIIEEDIKYIKAREKVWSESDYSVDKKVQGFVAEVNFWFENDLFATRPKEYEFLDPDETVPYPVDMLINGYLLTIVEFLDKHFDPMLPLEWKCEVAGFNIPVSLIERYKDGWCVI